MAFELNIKTGDITCRQGDSGDFTLSGIPDDREYTVYFAVRDNKNNIILEKSATPVEGDVLFEFEPEDTEKFTVPSGAKNKVYYWAVKLCYEPDNYEDTVIIGLNKTIGDVNKLIAYPKVVEGTVNANI